MVREERAEAAQMCSGLSVLPIRSANRDARIQRVAVQRHLDENALERLAPTATSGAAAGSVHARIWMERWGSKNQKSPPAGSVVVLS